MSKKYVEVTFMDSYDDAFGGNHEFLNVDVYPRSFYESVLKDKGNVISVQDMSDDDIKEYNNECDVEVASEIAVDVGEFVKSRLKKKLHIKEVKR